VLRRIRTFNFFCCCWLFFFFSVGIVFEISILFFFLGSFVMRREMSFWMEYWGRSLGSRLTPSAFLTVRLG
jgi:hypothetical protein